MSKATSTKPRKTHGTRLTHLAQRIFNTPLAIAPEKADAILQVIGPRLGLAIDDNVIDYSDDRADLTGHVPEGTALVVVDGTLAHRALGVKPLSGLTNYPDIRTEFLQALQDPGVKNIVLDCNSPGGEVNGLFELVDTIYQSRGKKPVYALVDQQACSACYAIASAADLIILPRTGVVGSIAVMTVHIDLSKFDDMVGAAYTYITSGSQKLDGNPHNQLSDGARQRITSEINRVDGILRQTVARNRSMDPEAIGALDGGLRYGELAVEAGLADEVMSPFDFFDRLRNEARDTPLKWSVAATEQKLLSSSARKNL